MAAYRNNFGRSMLCVGPPCYDVLLHVATVGCCWTKFKNRHILQQHLWMLLDAHSRSQRPRSVWSAPRIVTSGQVQHRKSAIHGLPVTLRMFRVKFEKSDWFWSQSIVFTKPFKKGISLNEARGRDSWCWPKGARPLGTRMTWCCSRLATGMRTSSIFNTQHVVTRHNRVAKRAQHVAPNNVTICCFEILRSFHVAGACKCWANNVGICCAEMLRPFGRGLIRRRKHRGRDRFALSRTWMCTNTWGLLNFLITVVPVCIVNWTNI